MNKDEKLKARALLFAFSQLPTIFDSRELNAASEKVQIKDFDVNGAFLSRAMNPDLAPVRSDFKASEACLRRARIRKQKTEKHNPRAAAKAEKKFWKRIHKDFDRGR